MYRILVVEDDEYIRENIVDLLESEKYLTLAFDNAILALQNIEVFNPDLIISDIIMPDMNGFEFLAKTKEDHDSNIPFIFLSANFSREEVRQVMNCGADDYILKPFSVDEILSKVKTRIAIKRQIKENSHEFTTNIMRYVSHELRTPLVSILGYSDLLSDGIEEFQYEELKKMLLSIKNSGQQLSEQIEKFIFYAEVATDYNHIKSDQNHTSDFCDTKEIREFLELLKSDKCILNKNELTIDLEEKRLKIKKEYLEFLIKELVQIAIKQSHSNYRINLIGKCQSDYYKIQFPPINFNLFEKYLKCNSLEEDINRTGLKQNGEYLGQLIINRIINIAKIKIEHEKNNQDTISILIPLVN